MININNKSWDKLRITDIENLLQEDDDETFFIEYKSDDVSSKKMIEEVSAFANTYGGYILLGVDDDKNISGCSKWTEQKIHTTIHDSITPIPSFDVKKMRNKDKKVLYIIKIDEGILPPYITSHGKIFERVSSGSFPINDSNKLTQLYYKREDQYKKIEEKLKIDDIKDNVSNLCGYLDMGFSLNPHDRLKIQNSFLNPDFEKIKEVIKKSKNHYSISKVGHSLVISIGLNKTTQFGKGILTPSSMHNFMEIMSDGSMKLRMPIYSFEDNEKASITQLIVIRGLFEEIYQIIFGNKFEQQFISALKYEKLTVLKQFIPSIKLSKDDKYNSIFEGYLKKHVDKYGNNLIITGNRIPKTGLIPIDKKYLSDHNIQYSSNNIIKELFDTEHFLLGYIDRFPTVTDKTIQNI